MIFHLHTSVTEVTLTAFCGFRMHGCCLTVASAQKSYLAPLEDITSISCDRSDQLSGHSHLMMPGLLFRRLLPVVWTGATRFCMVCQRTCWGRCSQYRTLLFVYLPAHEDVTTSLHCGVSYTGCQSLASLAPTYLTTDIHLVSEYGRRPLRSSTDRTLTVPRTHNRFGDRSFAVGWPRLWNSLLISLLLISSYGQFRRYLKNHLFAIWEITAQSDA